MQPMMISLMASIGVVGAGLLLKYLAEKSLWVSKSKIYLIGLLRAYSDKQINEAFIDIKEKLENKESKDMTEYEKSILKSIANNNVDVDLDKARIVFFLDIYESIGLKGDKEIIFNPFSNTIRDIVKNRTLLDVILKNQ